MPKKKLIIHYYYKTSIDWEIKQKYINIKPTRVILSN